LLLEAPEDILCFKFCPTDPNIIAGGCISGQVVMWDISQHADRFKQSRSASKGKDALGSLVEIQFTFFLLMFIELELKTEKSFT